MSNTVKQSDSFLVIVESPNKTKTILDILKNAGYKNAMVIASIGHIVSLKDGGPAFNSGIFPDKQFKMNLAIMEDKKKIVREITNKAAGVDKVFIMTDGDREGEIIAWSILKFCNIPETKCYRAIVHEITQKAIIEAINNPVYFNNNLVNAGLVRMMSDKLIGYGLSPLGKKYIGAKSIGRCQSVGLKLIYDRETEINNFIPELYFNLYLNFLKNNIHFSARYIGYKEESIEKFTKQADIDAVVTNCAGGNYLIDKVKKITHRESPKQPFCTATFQQEASVKLGLKVKDAMSCAQKLFEGIKIDGKHIGLITYMRTDSTELSKEFIPCLEAYIKNTFGESYYKGPRAVKKRATDQNGHEALRVVNPSITPEFLETHINNNLLVKVYRLIWQRTVASVMSDAVVSETSYTINNNGHKFCFSQKEPIYIGYHILYKTEPVRVAIENFDVGESLKEPELEVLKKFTQPKPRFTEASLVKELQDCEIGRPSTYATIVETLLSPTRGYATLEDKHIVPTDRGMQLAAYCDRSFPTLINITYTKNMEIDLDRIADGNLLWMPYMETFYNNLKKIINNTHETGIVSDMPEKVCPICSKNMVVRRSRFGKLFYGCSNYPECKGIANID